MLNDTNKDEKITSTPSSTLTSLSNREKQFLEKEEQSKETSTL